MKYVCECKAVSKNEIRKAINIKGAETILDIQNLTKASTGCGRCKNQVETLLKLELSKKVESNRQLKLDF